MAVQIDARAAMLKSRFSNIILKAQEKKLFDGYVTKSANIHRETPRKRQHEEEEEEEDCRTEAQGLKRQRQLREKEREAARIELEKMERAVDVEQNMQSVKDLETLARCSSLYFVMDRSKEEDKVVMGAFQGIRFWNPLEKIGLRIKDDQSEDDHHHHMILREEDEVEQGEIVLNEEEEAEEGEIVAER